MKIFLNRAIWFFAGSALTLVPLVTIIYWDINLRQDFGGFQLFETSDEEEEFLHIVKDSIPVLIVSARESRLSIYSTIRNPEPSPNSIDFQYLVFDQNVTTEIGWHSELENGLEMNLKDQNFDGFPERKIVRNRQDNTVTEYSIDYSEHLIEPVGMRRRKDEESP